VKLIEYYFTGSAGRFVQAPELSIAGVVYCIREVQITTFCKQKGNALESVSFLSVGLAKPKGNLND